MLGPGFIDDADIGDEACVNESAFEGSIYTSVDLPRNGNQNQSGNDDRYVPTGDAQNANVYSGGGKDSMGTSVLKTGALRIDRVDGSTDFRVLLEEGQHRPPQNWFSIVFGSGPGGSRNIQ